MTKEELISFLKESLKISVSLEDTSYRNPYEENLTYSCRTTVKLFLDLDGEEILISEDISTV